MIAVHAALVETDVSVLLIGGMAVNYYGYSRSTMDIDFMAAADDVDMLVLQLKKQGFINIERLDNVVFLSQENSPLRVDLLRVDAGTMGKMHEKAGRAEMYGLSFPVPALEDLMAMKLFALKENWDLRVHKDLPDIAQLTVLNSGISLARLAELCDEYADREIFDRCRKEIEVLQQA